VSILKLQKSQIFFTSFIYFVYLPIRSLTTAARNSTLQLGVLLNTYGRYLATYGPGTAIKSELFKPEVANRRANSAAPAHRAREARGTALRRAELGCRRLRALARFIIPTVCLWKKEEIDLSTYLDH